MVDWALQINYLSILHSNAGVVMCQIWRWMFLMNWAVLDLSWIPTYQLVPEVSPRWTTGVFLSSLWVGQFLPDVFWILNTSSTHGHTFLCEIA